MSIHTVEKYIRWSKLLLAPTENSHVEFVADQLKDIVMFTDDEKYFYKHNTKSGVWKKTNVKVLQHEIPILFQSFFDSMFICTKDEVQKQVIKIQSYVCKSRYCSTIISRIKAHPDLYDPDFEEDQLNKIPHFFPLTDKKVLNLRYLP